MDEPRPDWQARDPFVGLLLGAWSAQQKLVASLERVAPPLAAGEGCVFAAESTSEFVLAIAGLVCIGEAIERSLARASAPAGAAE